MLVEMAEGFFGARKSVEEESEQFAAMAAKVREFGQAALDRASLLHALLFDDETVHEFYLRIGVKPDKLLLWVEPSQARLFVKIPFAFTTQGRYSKLIALVYRAVFEAFDEYLNGRHYSAVRYGSRKRLSLHYKFLKDWGGNINRRIRSVNEGLAPSSVLGFAKGLDLGRAEAERVTGATIPGYASSLDQDLKIPPLDCLALGLKELPELPAPDKVEAAVASFAEQLYKADKERVQILLQGLEQGKHL